MRLGKSLDDDAPDAWQAARRLHRACSNDQRVLKEAYYGRQDFITAWYGIGFGFGAFSAVQRGMVNIILRRFNPRVAIFRASESALKVRAPGG